MLKKNILLIFTFFILSTIAICKDKFNSIDYIGFYTRNYTHYAKVGRYEEKEFEYPNVSNYRLILNYNRYPLVLLNSLNNVIHNTTNEYIEVSTNKSEKLKKISSFYYFPNENKAFFIQGKFSLGFFDGRIATTTYSENYQKVSVLLLEGLFFIDSLAPGVNEEYKNIPFNLKKSFANIFILKKYKYSIPNKEIDICLVFKSNPSQYDDSNYTLDKILNHYKW